MSKESQTNTQSGPGTKVTGLTPKNTTATPPIRNGASGETAESGNRNKRS